MKTPVYTTRIADWQRDGVSLRQVRREVFVVEQRVPEELEWDEHDGTCVHCIAMDDTGRTIGTGRLIADTPLARVGRMAVLEGYRGRGVGQSILDTLLSVAQGRGERGIELHAQTHALAFYERAGFAAEGPEFDEAGIPHRVMRLQFGR